MPGCSSPPVISASSEEPLAAGRVVGVPVEDLLQRHLAVQLGVQRHEDGAQAAPGVRPEDAEPLAVAGGRADGVAGRAVGVVAVLGRGRAEGRPLLGDFRRPGRGRLEEAPSLLMPDEQALDVGPQRRIVPTGAVQERRSLGRGQVHGPVEQIAQAAVAIVGVHVPSSGSSWSRSQARAKAQSRITVDSATSRASATSGSDIPSREWNVVTMHARGVHDREPVQRRVEAGQRHAMHLLDVVDHRIQRMADPELPLPRLSAPRVVDEDLPHGADDQAIGMVTVVRRLEGPAADELQDRFIDQGAGLERVVGSLAPHQVGGGAAEVVVEEGDHAVAGGGVAGAHGRDELIQSGIVWRFGHGRCPEKSDGTRESVLLGFSLILVEQATSHIGLGYSPECGLDSAPAGDGRQAAVRCAAMR